MCIVMVDNCTTVEECTPAVVVCCCSLGDPTLDRGIRSHTVADLFGTTLNRDNRHCTSDIFKKKMKIQIAW